MKAWTLCFLLALAPMSQSQNLLHVYNRDTGDPFKLTAVEAHTQTVGPLEKTRTVFTFANPYQKLTEVSFNVRFNAGQVLAGFGYWYGDEYVPGRLMANEEAWFIYSGITSRNRDPGIMEQVSPEQYHCQIYPIAIGHPVRIEVTSIGWMTPQSDRLLHNGPTWDELEAEGESANVQYRWFVDGKEDQSGANRASAPSVSWTPTSLADGVLISQRWKDGRYYVAGIYRGRPGLRHPAIVGLNQVYWVKDENEKNMDGWLFVGWQTSPKPVSCIDGRDRVTMEIQASSGDLTAKLWAQQVLAQGHWYAPKKVLDFSLRYQVPSSQTALLAVPKSEWKLMEQKRKEYKAWAKKQAQLAKKEAEEARKAQLAYSRNWRERKMISWRVTQGGDPEIRVSAQLAKTVFAILPDGTRLKLNQGAPGVWGGNFEIPASAPEGQYLVKIEILYVDGRKEIRTESYAVDRTKPTGHVWVEERGPDRTLCVESEAGLARVIAYWPDGKYLLFKEVNPGHYEAALPHGASGQPVIQLVDSASNKAFAAWYR